MSLPIAVGVDGSGESMAAIDWAADEAALRGTGLRLVYASRWQEHRLQAVKPTREAQGEEDRGLLAAAEQRAHTRRPGISTSPEETEDAPARLLVDVGSDSELLVLGSSALGSASGFIVGSVGQEVVADAKRPVVLVRPGYGKEGRAEHGEIVVGLDVGHGDDGGELLEFAFDFAAKHSAPLHVLHTWHAPAFHHREAEVRGERETELAALVRPYRDKFPQVEVTEDAAPGGRPADRLVDSAADAALVVVGRRRAAKGSHTGSIAHAVLHHAACPVAVVPHA
ncbi:universal stress protein [Streptomyces sp. NPDC019396]|uniref:universal stress protein n=1 Tax=Streptomyces sp. NPDC019396 TaxID=3154687 RepID=UPI0033E66266